MKVKDLMTSNIYYVTPEASIMEVSIQMNKRSTGILPVCDSRGSLVGVITDRDIVTRFLPNMSDNLYAKDIMTTNVVTVSPDATIAEASERMAKSKVRRIFVQKNNRLIGVLSIGDLAKRKLFLCEVGDIYNALVVDD